MQRVYRAHSWRTLAEKVRIHRELSRWPLLGAQLVAYRLVSTISEGSWYNFCCSSTAHSIRSFDAPCCRSEDTSGVSNLCEDIAALAWKCLFARVFNLD